MAAAVNKFIENENIVYLWKLVWKKILGKSVRIIYAQSAVQCTFDPLLGFSGYHFRKSLI